MTRAEFTRRLRAFERGRHVALAIGALPLLAVYLAVHTRWLKPYMQDHKHLVVLAMIVVPLAWLLAMVRGWGRLGPRWLRLQCRQCGQALAAATDDVGPPRCTGCGTATVDVPGPPA